MQCKVTNIKLRLKRNRSNLGSNLGLLAERTGMDSWDSWGHPDSPVCIADCVKVPEVDVWGVTYLQSLLTQRLQATTLATGRKRRD